MEKFFSKNIQNLFVFSVFTILAGFISDLILFYDLFDSFLITMSVIAVVMNSSLLILVLTKHVKLKIGYIFVVYISLLILFIISIYDLLNKGLITHLLVRDVLLFPLVIFSIGFIVSKRQMVATSVIVSVVFPALLLSSKTKMLVDFAPFISIMTIVSTFAFTFFLSSLKNSMETNLEKEMLLADKNSKLESLNSDKDSLLSVISHDLIGPIGTTQQTIKFLLEEDIPEADKKYLLEIVDSSVDNIYTVLNNLLLWARNTKGALECKPEYLKLFDLVESTIVFFGNEIKAKNINIINNVSPNLLSFCDKLLIETTLRNLISNSIKFTNENGTVIIDNKQMNEFNILSIKDNGIGISEDNQKKIVNEIRGVTRLGTKNEKGSGLGLKICKEFVIKNGGDIWFESKEGIGTEFLFSVPKSEST